jgi:uncharacterized protein (TIGR02996 family)
MEPPIRAEDIREAPRDEHLRSSYVAALERHSPERAALLRLDTEHHACALGLAASEAGESTTWLAQVARSFVVYLTHVQGTHAELVERLCALDGWTLTAAYEALALVQGNQPIALVRADLPRAREIAEAFAPYGAVEMYTVTGRRIAAVREPQRDELLAAIAREPEDEANRMVYADALEQRGDPRSEYVRLEARFATLSRELAAREATLDAGWLAMVRRRYGVELVGAGPNQIVTIRAIRQVLGSGLYDAKRIMHGLDGAAYPIAADLPLARAVDIRVLFGNAVTQLVT